MGFYEKCGNFRDLGVTRVYFSGVMRILNYAEFRGKSGRMGEWEREEEDKVKMKCGKWMGLWVTNYFKPWGLFQMSTASQLRS